MISRAGLLGLLCLAATFSCGRAIVSTGTECTNAPPNSARIALGVDISRLDLLPIDFTNNNGYKMPIIEFTCDEGRVYTANGVQYQMPDQIFRVSNIPGGLLSAAVETYKTSSDVRKNFNAQVDVAGAYSSFSFSASASYSSLQNTVTNQQRYVSDTSSYYSSHKMELYPYYVLPMNPVAKLFLEQEIGDKTYKQDPEIYHRFIDLFGTHFFSSAHFGGQIRVVYSTSEAYLKDHSEEEMKLQAEASYMATFTAKASISKEETNIDEDFEKQTSNTVRYYGGSTNLLSDNALEAWQPTVDGNPWLFSGKLRPISDLIENEVHKAGMEEAALQHVMRDHFIELRRQIESAIAKLGYTSTVLKLEDRLDTMEQLGIGQLSQRRVQALSDDIDNAVTVPRWFTESTELCFQWRTDGDARQCSGSSDGKRCALPGKQTKPYFDDTDGANKGCLLQWSIQSTGADTWFNKVQLCYRWEAEDDIGQCSHAKNKELCAHVNSYTPWYEDDTDGRGGGCKMAWKLKVPQNAPMWLKTTKLCFEWRADKDKGQCSAQSSKLCATANGWTSYYVDDSDGRGGGCYMSWGLYLGV